MKNVAEGTVGHDLFTVASVKMGLTVGCPAIRLAQSSQALLTLAKCPALGKDRGFSVGGAKTGPGT